jgi:uncharacterized protein YndB with AHSA1/START domain
MNPFRLELSSAVRIDAPREHVFKVFSDIGHWTEWCGVCLCAQPVDPTNTGDTDIPATDNNFTWRPGQRIHLKFRMAGLGVPFNVIITESSTAAEASKRIVWSSTKLTVTAVRTFTFADDPAGSSAGGPTGAPGTTVTDHKLFTSPVLPLRLFYPRPIIRRMTQHMLFDLKTECERPVV